MQLSADATRTSRCAMPQPSPLGANSSRGTVTLDITWQFGPMWVTATSALAEAAMRCEEPSIGIMFGLDSQQPSRPSGAGSTAQTHTIAIWRSDAGHGMAASSNPKAVWVRVEARHFERRWPALLPKEGQSRHSGDGALATLARNSIETLWQCRADFAPDDLLTGFEAALDMLDQSLRFTRRAHRSKEDLYEQVLGFINRELANLELAPQLIAHRHGCSLRALQALFAKHQSTVAGTIRLKRLERCLSELQDGRAQRVGQVAQRWGFSDAAHFSKLFKSTFGVSPSSIRRAACLV